LIDKGAERGSVEEPVYANQSQILAEMRRQQGHREAMEERQRMEQVDARPIFELNCFTEIGKN